jgi:peptidoglycan-N-acetylglucosamine deacetylase
VNGKNGLGEASHGVAAADCRDVHHCHRIWVVDGTFPESRSSGSGNVPTIVYFPETGQYVEGEILAFWWEHGGVPLFGYPVSARLKRDDSAVQYFERAVLELHTENDPEWRVSPRRLGEEAAGPQLLRSENFKPQRNSRGPYFVETGHELGQTFIRHYDRFDGQKIFGPPISTEFERDGKYYQYFERAVLEYDPDNPRDWHVLQPRIGREAAIRDGVDTSPQPKIASVPDFDPQLWPQGGAGSVDQIVYLTFDDGPDETWTPDVLVLLDEYDALATFFVLGNAATAYPELIEDIADAGHAIGNHSFDHQSLAGVSWGQFEWQMQTTANAVGDEMADCMRPPYGAMDGNTEAFAAQFGYDVILWDVDPRDWERPGGTIIADRILNEVSSGDVVLLHDGGGDRSQTVEALETVLERLSELGYEFEPMCQ